MYNTFKFKIKQKRQVNNRKGIFYYANFSIKAQHYFCGCFIYSYVANATGANNFHAGYFSTSLGDGTISKFRVVEKIDHNVSNADMSKAIAPVNPDKLGLNLMTCGGKWDVGSQQYDERTLARTEKI